MSKKWRFLLVLAVLLLAGFFLYPTVKWYFLLDEETQNLVNKSKEDIRDYARKQAKDDIEEIKTLAKDESLLNAPVPDEYRFLKKTAAKNYKYLDKKVPGDWTLGNIIRGYDSDKAVIKELELHHKDVILDLKAMKEKILQLGLDLNGGMSIVLTAHPKYVVSDEEETAEEEPKNFFQKTWQGFLVFLKGKEKPDRGIESDIDRAMEIINSRVDSLGVTEPQIRKMNDNQILIELPGEVDPERVNIFLKGKGTLGFHLLDDEASTQIENYLAAGGSIKDGQPADTGIIPTGLVVLGYYQKDNYDIDQFVRYLVVDEIPGLSGDYIKSATVYSDPTTGKPNVSFYLDAEGGEIFYQLTRDNVDRYLAVVMDDKIKAYARIKEPLRDQVVITGFGKKEADDLALILRTAALPVELEVESMQQVGATLGDDTITAGMFAMAIGFAAVFLFMLIYYKGAGIIADIALILNLFIIMAVLATFNMTLTMTSIAGLILNVGMAVDANVIIFERIKDELRLGKSRSAAIDLGFKKALWTVLDANITTFIAAIFLSLVGSGPIQGFAVTLSVGIASSMFTAIFVSRLLFDFFTDVVKRKKVSIGWGHIQ
jgi:preprotein translocase subunit SecD